MRICNGLALASRGTADSGSFAEGPVGDVATFKPGIEQAPASKDDCPSIMSAELRVLSVGLLAWYAPSLLSLVLCLGLAEMVGFVS